MSYYVKCDEGITVSRNPYTTMYMTLVTKKFRESLSNTDINRGSDINTLLFNIDDEPFEISVDDLKEALKMLKENKESPEF